MRRTVSVISAAAIVAAMTAATAVPAFAHTGEEFLPDISVRVGGPNAPVSGSFTLSDGCVDFFGAIDVPGHASDTSNEFEGPVCFV